MADEAQMAARVGDPIEHSSMLGGALAGIAVGLVIGAIVAATILSGGTALPFILGAIGAVCTGITAGFTIGGFQGASRTPRPEASSRGPTPCSSARASRRRRASGQGPVQRPRPVKIGEGSAGVLTEGRSQARKTDKTTCQGKIADGCHSVFVGGPLAALEGVADGDEIPEGLHIAIDVVDVIGLLTGSVGHARSRRPRRTSTRSLVGADLGLFGIEKGLKALGYKDASEDVGYLRTGLEVVMLGKGFHDAHAENAEAAERALEGEHAGTTPTETSPTETSPTETSPTETSPAKATPAEQAPAPAAPAERALPHRQHPPSRRPPKRRRPNRHLRNRRPPSKLPRRPLRRRPEARSRAPGSPRSPHPRQLRSLLRHPRSQPRTGPGPRPPPPRTHSRPPRLRSAPAAPAPAAPAPAPPANPGPAEPKP